MRRSQRAPCADLGHNLDGERQLTLGADTGLRGYDPNTFDGTSRVVTNLEWRHRITGELLHVAALSLGSPEPAWRR